MFLESLVPKTRAEASHDVAASSLDRCKTNLLTMQVQRRLFAGSGRETI